MKRLAAFTTAIMSAVCLASCSVKGGERGTVANGLGGGYQSAVSVTIGDMSAEGTVKRFGEGMWEIEFESPNSLAGIKLSFTDGTAEAGRTAKATAAEVCADKKERGQVGRHDLGKA